MKILEPVGAMGEMANRCSGAEAAWRRILYMAWMTRWSLATVAVLAVATLEAHGDAVVFMTHGRKSPWRLSSPACPWVPSEPAAGSCRGLSGGRSVTCYDLRILLCRCVPVSEHGTN